MTTFADYSAAQILAAMEAALKAEDMPAVASLLRLLAVKDPSAAEAVLAVIDMAGDVQSPMQRWRELNA